MATVLVVDDRPLNRELVRTILGYEGHQVLEADNGAQALRMLRNLSPDLMISDVLMPDMDGYELAREVRALPTSSSLPIVFYTANYLEREARPIAAACGVDYVVAKDGDPKALLEAVGQALRTMPRDRQVVAEDDFSREHLRVLNTKLIDKVRELEEKERLAHLVDAAIVVGGDLGVQTTMKRIVVTARSLMVAAFTCLDVRDETGFLLGSETDGLDPRPDDAHPARHLIRRTVVSKDGHVGDLVVVRTGAAEPFSPADRALVNRFGDAAGAAIGNAHRYDDARRRQAWLQAATEVTTILLGDEPGDALGVVMRSAKTVSDADLAWIEIAATPVTVPADASVEILTRPAIGEVRSGVAAELGARLVREVAATGRPVLLDDAGRGIDLSTGPLIDLAGVGSLLAVPLQAGQDLLGALILGNRLDRRPFTPFDIDMATAFAGHAAVALEFVRVQTDRERLRVAEDRDRIARDLHDVVIQRLFAIGLRLEAVAPRLPDIHAAVVQDTTNELNLTIDDIRDAIFSLNINSGRTALRERLHVVIERAEHNLGFRPEVYLDDALDQKVPAALHLHLLATVNEALSNVARHAQAAFVHVAVRVVDEPDEALVITVIDDGRGLPANREESGLANLRRRAELAGGSMSTRPGVGGSGLVLSWRVPLRA